MFIYFPEFLYKRTKSYIENTFTKPLDINIISGSLDSIITKALQVSKNKTTESNLKYIINSLKIIFNLKIFLLSK